MPNNSFFKFKNPEELMPNLLRQEGKDKKNQINKVYKGISDVYEKFKKNPNPKIRILAFASLMAVGTFLGKNEAHSQTKWLPNSSTEVKTQIEKAKRKKAEAEQEIQNLKDKEKLAKQADKLAKQTQKLNEKAQKIDGAPSYKIIAEDEEGKDVNPKDNQEEINKFLISELARLKNEKQNQNIKTPTSNSNIEENNSNDQNNEGKIYEKNGKKFTFDKPPKEIEINGKTYIRVGKVLEYPGAESVVVLEEGASRNVSDYLTKKYKDGKAWYETKVGTQLLGDNGGILYATKVGSKTSKTFYVYNEKNQ